MRRVARGHQESGGGTRPGTEKARTAAASLLLAKALSGPSVAIENSGREEQVESVVAEAMRLYVAAHYNLGSDGCDT